MLETNTAVPSFPALNYHHPQPGPTATDRVGEGHVQAFHIGRFLDHHATGEVLKDVLHRYGVPKTGNKEQLVQILAKLAAATYQEKLPQLDAFFAHSLDPARLGRDAGRIAEEVVQHLTRLVDADVEVTLEIQARAPQGLSDSVIRTVSENCRTLRFNT